jgi:membrane protein implicated in regulation of membrane protease activity
VAGQELIGKIGSVTTRVRGGDLAAEVRVVVAGLPHHYLAYCPEALAVGTKVLVVGTRGARQIDVEPWTQWAVPGNDAAGPMEGM